MFHGSCTNNFPLKNAVFLIQTLISELKVFSQFNIYYCFILLPRYCYNCNKSLYTCCIRNQDFFFFFKVFYTTSSTLQTSNGKHLNNLTAKPCTVNALFSHCSFCPLSSISTTVCCPLQHYYTIWDFKATDESPHSFLPQTSCLLLYFQNKLLVPVCSCRINPI